MDNRKRLFRSRKDKMIGGVCGGIAAYFDADPTIVRLIYALATIFTAFAGVIVYAILWIIIPEGK